ncbi:MAG: DUF2752 domain-containing protein [Armatimonadota bacterium]
MTDNHPPLQTHAALDPIAHARRLRFHESLQAALICGTIVALSFVLHPDSHGYGTHRQLLMPPCFFRVLTHLPCPFCGMTTGFTLMARGQVAEAAQSNFMAPPGFIATVLIGLLGLWGLITKRRWIPAFARTKIIPKLLLAVILAFWIANIMNSLVLRI